MGGRVLGVADVQEPCATDVKALEKKKTRVFSLAATFGLLATRWRLGALCAACVV